MPHSELHIHSIVCRSEPDKPAIDEAKKQRKGTTKRVSADSAHLPNKHAKLGHARMKVAAGTPHLPRKSSSLSCTSADNYGDYTADKWNHLADTAVDSSTKKPAGSGMKCDYSSESKSPIKDTFESQIKTDDMEKQSTLFSYFENSKTTKDFTGSSNPKPQRNEGKKVAAQLRPVSGSSMSKTSETEISTKYLHKGKTGSNGLPDLNYPASVSTDI